VPPELDRRPDPDPETFADQARAWLADHRSEAPRDYGAILPPDLRDEAATWQRRLFDAGFAGITWPAEFGGRGLSGEHQVAWITECARAQVPPFLNMVGYVLAGGSIRAFGTPEQQRDHLRPILTGDRVWCQLFSEPDAGSDLASLTTTAIEDGDHFLVNGQKVWCSNGRVADWGILMARTDPAAPAHRGISFFLMDMSLPGVETRPLRQMNGEAEFDEVFLSDVAVPADCLIGGLGDGWRVAMATLTNERGYIGAAGISLGRRIDGLLAGADDLGPIESQHLIQAWIRGKSLWMTGQRQGPVATILGSVTKLGTTELMFDLAELQADLAGADSMLDDPVIAGLMSAPGARIAGGTSQVQRNLIGERILGLPKGPP
jgi:alkylation response protein AidB-like acyl-CoA dehydrogenase